MQITYEEIAGMAKRAEGADQHAEAVILYSLACFMAANNSGTLAAFVRLASVIEADRLADEIADAKARMQ